MKLPPPRVFLFSFGLGMVNQIKEYTEHKLITVILGFEDHI